MAKMEKSPAVSVIMPAFNSEPYIEQAIRSVLDQSFSDWELLVIDNGSTDQTCQVVTRLMDEDSRIQLLYTTGDKHCPAVARLFGIQNAHGEWVAFLDSDDFWLPEKLQIQLDTAAATGSDFLFTASAFMEKAGNRLDYIFTIPERIGYPEILKQDVISCSSVLIKKDLLDGTFTETDSRSSEDFAAWIRILRDKDTEAVGINQPLLCYRITHSSLSSNKLRSALRTFRTYRHVGLSIWTSIWYWLHYAIRSAKKYTSMYISKF